ncbi:MAG: ribosomal-protein-alanine N-acetyltransferase [Bacteroidia bacterium]|jgi:ribosomal-protein-alanine N-acetyltransferase
MKSSQFPTIETERLVLRRLVESDWRMISYLRSDKEVNQFVERSSAESKEKALGFISKTNLEIENNALLYWVMTEKEGASHFVAINQNALFK